LTEEYAIIDAGGLEILRTGLEAYDRARSARETIDKTGLMVKDRFGAAKSHPLLPVERDARSSYLQALKQLNLDIEPLKNGPGRPPGQ